MALRAIKHNRWILIGCRWFAGFDGKSGRRLKAGKTSGAGRRIYTNTVRILIGGCEVGALWRWQVEGGCCLHDYMFV